MKFIICLAATLAACQAARIPRGIGPFPNFHAVHHGHGATSYQNVQMESYGSVPVPTEDHYHNHHPHQQYHEQTFLIHVPESLHHDDHIGVHHDESILDHPRQLQHFIVVERDQEEVPVEADDHDDAQHYITLEQATILENGIHQLEVNDGSHIHYIGDNYQHDHDYEYH